ncbi:GEVED domain-containing protein [Spirosoma sp. KNUC1025]|uniref:GEVED domain-containing protein n=1 Tax=Spirosoma sp. KNUC1025 TaxID=2894082 RepID=UPI00386D9CCA|nr:DUF11 domain-containing protein [Spirosoma sp. KNUC1025]
MTAIQRQLVDQQAERAYSLKKATNAAFSSITYVPIRPHILRRSDGTGGMSLASINQAIAITNSYYLLNGYGIQFYFCGTSPDYVDNDAQYNSTNDENAITLGHDVLNALNQYYVNSFASGAGGYAYYPSNSVVSTRSFILNESWNEADMGNRLIPHELGHNFNLVHTFGELPGNGTLGSGTTNELVTRGAGANCTTAGDYICDTPADPYNKPGATLISVNGCVQYDPNSTARDANGEAYSPSLSNIMSYYFPCTHNFTPGQYDRMQAALALRQSHTAYTLDCAPTVVVAPGNIAASVDNNSVILTWQDNANNEMGYFIERSLSATTGFVPIGGVGPNSTAFTDAKANPFTTYYYRVRPSNSTTTGISQVASIKTPACHPTYASLCTYNDGLSSVAVNNVVLSQNTGCSSGAYSSFTATSTTVVAGMTYPVSGTLLSQSYQEGVTIWADLDRDGLFNASRGEQLFQTPATVTGQFSGSITIPASLSVGTLAIRITVAFAAIPNDPCGSYNYGETEDYVLNVVLPTADLSMSMRASNLVLAVNQVTSYSLTVRNDGPNDATGIQWQNRLPEGLLFVSGGPNVTASTTAVSGTGDLSLAPGQSTTFTYQLRATLPGTYVNAAQIIASGVYDPDSQPNSGTGDGQDDQASVGVRTISGSVNVYTSPNPDQLPLPAVISNQPAPDPAKADLSLAMAVNQRTPRLGKLVTFTISVSNAGGLPSQNVVIRDTLRGMTFTASPSGMSVVGSGDGYSILEGTIASLASNSVTQLIFTAQTTTLNYITNAAQIWSAATPDPDSSPGSVTPTANNLNGEDDVVQIDLRVLP